MTTEIDRPKCVILYRTHVWPFSGVTPKGIDTEIVLRLLQDGVSAYNKDESRKYDYSLVILHNVNEAKLSNRDSFGCAYHDFDVADITNHGFITNRCREFKSILATINIPDGAANFVNGHPFWFNGEYGLLDYYLRTDSSFDYYWNVEYDCWPTGDFAAYLKCFDDAREDFLVSRLTKRRNNKPWHPWWSVVAGFSPTDSYGSYFPLFRLSNKAVHTLVTGYIQERVIGYCEALVPTYLAHKGLSCRRFARYNGCYKNKCKMRHKIGNYIDRVG